MERTLSLYGFEDYFSTVVAVEDVANSKPAPDCYLKALEEIGVAAGDAMAVEDTQHGLEAATSAGLRCVVIPTELSVNHDFSTASRVYSSLPQWLSEELV